MRGSPSVSEPSASGSALRMDCKSSSVDAEFRNKKLPTEKTSIRITSTTYDIMQPDAWARRVQHELCHSEAADRTQHTPFDSHQSAARWLEGICVCIVRPKVVPTKVRRLRMKRNGMCTAGTRCVSLEYQLSTSEGHLCARCLRANTVVL